MKKLKLFLMLFIAAVSACNFVACDKDDDKDGGASSIVGTWVWQEDGMIDSYTFSANGSYTNTWQEGGYTDFERGTYTYDGKILILRDSDGDTEMCQVTISGNKLTFKYEDDGVFVYTRK